MLAHIWTFINQLNTLAEFFFPIFMAPSISSAHALPQMSEPVLGVSLAHLPSLLGWVSILFKVPILLQFCKVNLSYVS